MRVCAALAANWVACAVLLGLAAVAVVLVVVLGPFGLVLLGLLTLLVCSQFALNEHAPTWGAAPMRARMEQAASPEERAAMLEAQRQAVAPARFYQGCGGVLVLAGVAGLAWQHWG